MFEQAMAAAREERRTMEKKDEAKRWKEIGNPLSLADALTRLSKNDLSDIRSNLGIKNASALNKPQLIELLAKQVPMELSATLQQLDETRYATLKRIAEGGGQAFVSLEFHEYEYFKLRGLAFTGSIGGRHALVMPQEILEEFRKLDVASLRAAVRKHTEWLQISQGLLYYYGFLSTYDLVRMVEDYTGARVDTYDYLNVLFQGIAYGYAIRANMDGFTNEDVFDVEQVIQEHLARPNVPFYRFTKAQLLRAGKPGFVDRSPAYHAFVDFLRHSYQVDVEEAEDEAQFCVQEIQIGESMSNIVQAMTEEFEILTMDVLQSLTHHLTRLHNNTRQWVLKGHTPSELRPLDSAALRPLPSPMGGVGGASAKGQVVHIATGKKVGRNDPCPCGSGKKYKKCCGG